MKHKLYGYEIEASGLPNGIAIGFSSHFRGSVSDIAIFKKMVEFHNGVLQKLEKGKNIKEIGEVIDTYPKYWANLMDKGYQGAKEFMRVIHSKKETPLCVLGLDDVAYSKTFSSHRIIVENCFGRLCNLWSICGAKYRWRECQYDVIFPICMALTNQHISCSPLRVVDFDNSQRTKNRHYSVGKAVVGKGKLPHGRWGVRRKRRTEVQFGRSGTCEEVLNIYGSVIQ